MSFKREVESEEELNQLKVKCLKCKTILLSKENKHPLFNINSLTKRQKEKFLKELNVMMDTMNEQEIDEDFNSIVCDDLLDPKRDISQYRVYETTGPNHSILYEPSKDKKEEVL